MKILLIGGTGTLGSTLTSYFQLKNDVITAGRNSGNIQFDMTKEESIRSLFKKTGNVDAIICTAGEAKWANLSELTEADFEIGIRSKLMGQVNLVRYGLNYLNPKGSITLTTGILADDPVKMTASAALVNGAIHSFVKAAALEMKNNQRINAVSPGLVEDSAKKYKAYFSGHVPITMQRLLSGYIQSVEGSGNGEIIRIY